MLHALLTCTIKQAAASLTDSQATWKLATFSTLHDDHTRFETRNASLSNRAAMLDYSGFGVRA